MKTRNIRNDFGLEILDIDLSQALPDSVFTDILDYFYQYSVLLFRQQSLTPQAQVALCHRFSQPRIETRQQFNTQECAEASTIGNILSDTGKQLSFFAHGVFGRHTDGSAACHVNAATFVYAVKFSQLRTILFNWQTSATADVEP